MSAPLSTGEILALPAQHAARVVAMKRLDAARAAFKRYEEGDEEGLHDVRVALRRLRSWVRAYRAELKDTLRGKTRRRLAAIARVTNGARDAEVALRWIASQSAIPARGRAGRDHVTEVLRRECDDCARRLRSALVRELPKAMKALADELAPHQRHRTATRKMATATRAILRRHADNLVTSLSVAASRGDFASIHRARIRAKRLRYLLEPLDTNPDAASLEKQLVLLQDALGVVCDSHRIAERLVREIGEAAAIDARGSARAELRIEDEESADASSLTKVGAGLMELAQRAVRSERDAGAAATKRWSSSRVKRLLAPLGAIAKTS